MFRKEIFFNIFNIVLMIVLIKGYAIESRSEKETTRPVITATYPVKWIDTISDGYDVSYALRKLDAMTREKIIDKEEVMKIIGRLPSPVLQHLSRPIRPLCPYVQEFPIETQIEVPQRESEKDLFR